MTNTVFADSPEIGDDLLASLLRPVAKDVFFDKYWEQSPLHLNEGKNFDHLLKAADIDQLFRFADANIRVLKLKNGQSIIRKIPKIGNTPDFYSIYQAWNEGYSISVDFLNRYWPPVIELCQNLESILHFGVAANVYFTPANNRCFRAHYDGHEVFALQIEGSKKWDVWQRTLDPPPNKGLEFEEQPSTDNALMKITVKTGDILYLPRGYPHQACTADERSLHLSLQIHTATAGHLLQKLGITVDVSDPDTRRSLPPGFLDRPDEVIKQLDKWLGKEIDRQKITTAMEQLRRELMYQGQPAETGYFAINDVNTSITMKTHVRHRNPARCIIGYNDQRAWLMFHSRLIPAPLKMYLALKYVAEQKQFCVGELPGSITDEDRKNIIRRLVQEGLLTFDN